MVGLQGILISAANASKLLWGSKESASEIRRPLRESVGVTEESPLSSRHLRNDFEHFDERLEKWFRADGSHNYIGRVIGTAGAIVVKGAEPTDQFGHYNPSTAVVTFWERSASIQLIVTEADRICTALQATP